MKMLISVQLFLKLKNEIICWDLQISLYVSDKGENKVNIFSEIRYEKNEILILKLEENSHR